MLNKIELIKKIRMRYGFDLYEAKKIVEEANCDEFMVDVLAKAAADSANGRDRPAQLQQESTSQTPIGALIKAPYSPFNF